jgi:hypothetical protein
VTLIRRPTPGTVRAVALTSALVVALWIISRTTGLPLGPERWEPEPFGRLDIIASGAELVTFVACVRLASLSAGPLQSSPRKRDTSTVVDNAGAFL